MITNKQLKRVIAVLLFVGLFPVIVSMAVENSGEFYVVRGIVEYASENTITIKKKQYDITGVPVLNINGEAVVKIGETLHGKIAVLKYREGKLVSVRIFPHMQE